MKYGSWTLGQIEALINKIGEENAHRLLRGEITLDIRGFHYLVSVNYDLAHEAQIKEAKFDLVTDYDRNLIRKNPTEHLYPSPSTGVVEQRITLVHLNRYAKRPEVIAEMDKLNVRPVLSPEFLALTKAHPDLQRKFPLVGLGSVWEDSAGSRHILYACGSSGGRRLYLYWDDSGWREDCRFPAVCK